MLLRRALPYTFAAMLVAMIYAGWTMYSRSAANRLAEELIAEGLASGDFMDDPDDLTAEQIAEIRLGIERGLEAAAAGRVKSSAQAVAEARQRHGFPPSWASDREKPQTMR